MRLLRQLGLTAGFAILVLASSKHHYSGRRAAYCLDNNPAGCSIIASEISVADGTLSSPVKIATGGKGLHDFNATSGSTTEEDGLFSQGSVVVSEDYLFTVNSGSNTLSMFLISDDDPLHPTLVENPADTLGQFPMSVAYSAKLKTACVLNGGAVSGVTCFSTHRIKGLTVLDKAPRSVTPALNQTTPPGGPPGTASDIFFNPSSTALFATIKGDPGSTPPMPGSIFAWPVIRGVVSTSPVVTKISDIFLDFGSVFLGSDSSFFVTDPSFGGSILDVSPTLQITERAHIDIPNNLLMCWTVYVPWFDSVYAIDARTTIITSINPATGAINSQFSFDSSLVSGLDTAVDRTWMYVLTGSGAIAVISLAGSNSGTVPSQVQALNLSGLAEAHSLQGMAIYPSCAGKSGGYDIENDGADGEHGNSREEWIDRSGYHWQA